MAVKLCEGGQPCSVSMERWARGQDGERSTPRDQTLRANGQALTDHSFRAKQSERHKKEAGSWENR